MNTACCKVRFVQLSGKMLNVFARLTRTISSKLLKNSQKIVLEEICKLLVIRCWECLKTKIEELNMMENL